MDEESFDLNIVIHSLGGSRVLNGGIGITDTTIYRLISDCIGRCLLIYPYRRAQIPINSSRYVTYWLIFWTLGGSVVWELVKIFSIMWRLVLKWEGAVVALFAILMTWRTVDRCPFCWGRRGFYFFCWSRVICRIFFLFCCNYVFFLYACLGIFATQLLYALSILCHSTSPLHSLQLNDINLLKLSNE